jgi:hypothetical protein
MTKRLLAPLLMVLTGRVTKDLIADSGNVFERFHKAMEAFCGSDNLRQRLLAVQLHLMPLRVNDFPEHMRRQFHQLMEDLLKSQQPRFRDTKRVEIAKALLSLYTKAARLDGVFQAAV